MALPLHLQMFKLPPAPAPCDTFHHFSNLPPELRNKIWWHAMQRQRMIKVCVRPPELVHAVVRTRLESMPANQDTRKYGLTVGGLQTMSKMFRINQESREAALSFYRVRISCWLAQEAGYGGLGEPGTLYFNPEHDCLQFIQNHGPIHEFWYDLRTTYDPHHIGLLSLGIEQDGLDGPAGLCYVDASNVTSPVLECFKETLLQIRQVFFLHVQPCGRYVYRLYNNLESHQYVENLGIPLEVPTAIYFDVLRPDPRSVCADLPKVYIQSDSNEMIQSWKRLRRNWLGDSGKAQPDERVLLSLGNNYYGIRSHQELNARLQESRELWLESRQKHQKALFEDTASSAQSAFGFWLFPTEAFARSDPMNRPRGYPAKILDLSAYHPELGLAMFT
ncbi:hypothetical protein HJFPF1_12997 [Paramyrothecium foliicola]|nr:hypothetical protein HJFPF1_12997 [Paramyrothecium foliicola]